MKHKNHISNVYNKLSKETKSSMNAIPLALTNVYAKGDYTACLYLGSEQSPVNLIIDTGSSTLVVEPSAYQPDKDKTLVATPAVQEVNYGIGGWAGAVIHSQLHFLDHNHDPNEQTKVADTSIAIVEAEPSSTFGQADGILGMAYHHLNKSFDLSDYFHNADLSSDNSYPWPFNISSDVTPENPPNFVDLRAFKSFLWKYPEHDIKPLFTQIAEQHIVENRFSFYGKRSSVNVEAPGINAITNKPEELTTLQQDPLNQGQLILGGGEAQTHLYQGEFQYIKVLHDVYYNVELLSLQVGDNPPITAAPLAEKDIHNYFTNAIVDTGASLTVLTHELYEQVIEQLSKVNPEYSKLLASFTDVKAQYKGIDASQLDLSQWPDITFSFTGENGEPVSLTCPPTHYWQTNTPEQGKACFKLLSQLPNWPNQTLVGLPLITNYYTVFDRTVADTGVISFAKQR
ncbi:A1 family peptidase [Thalassotalea sp. M1531]|uniref:A1 family peptidase n=1 Tax=Thalassotalea algicola TaxID=2716224 RepID=A0A7Y0Q7L7_9GAMM|nr:pepsin-like aspartic protease [Thalassotalea algicola]NMP33214.1 A1 family peptidase [Thalassotalea algicola]